MDELLGFDLTSKNVDEMCDRIQKLCRDHEFEEALVEANSAKTRFPHNFKVLHSYANIYYYRYMTKLSKEDADNAISM